MRVRLASFLVVTALCSSLGACGDGEPDATTITLGAESDGRTVSARTGQQIVIRLASNPSTGWRWDVKEEPDARIVGAVSSRFEPGDAGTPPRVGVPGMQVWTLEAMGPGETKLQLDQIGPARDAPAARSFRLKFVVK